MWNGDAIAKIGIGNLLPSEHAVDVSCFDKAAVYKQLPNLAYSVLFVGCMGLQLYLLFFNRNHRCLQRHCYLEADMAGASPATTMIRLRWLAKSYHGSGT